MEETSHPFQLQSSQRSASSEPLLTCRLAPSTARREHDAPDQDAAIDEFETCPHDVARCTRFGRAGPSRRIRGAPWRTSLPLADKDRAGRRLLSFTAGERAQHEWLVERCQTPASPSKSPRSTADPFDRREPPSPFTKRDPRRKRREPSVHPFPCIGPRECFEAPFVMYVLNAAVSSSARDALTRRCYFASVIDTTREQRNRCSSSSLDPKRPLAGTAPNPHPYGCCERLWVRP